MACGWQELDHINDDGIDGLILDRKRERHTGTIYHVQVKCGEGWAKRVKKRPGFLTLNLGPKYIKDHRPRWNALQGPVILVYVDFHSRKAWWCDLKSESSYCPAEAQGAVLLPCAQRFGHHSLGHLRSLRGFSDLDRSLVKIELGRRDLVLPSFSRTLKSQAWEFYRAWASEDQAGRSNPKLKEVQVSRVGWRHITRRGRGLINITQSLMLLGAARRIIMENDAPYQIAHPRTRDTSQAITMSDHLSLRSKVLFPNRQQAVVQVILLRKQSVEHRTGAIDSKLWFYSVHEPRRGKDVH